MFVLNDSIAFSRSLKPFNLEIQLISLSFQVILRMQQKLDNQLRELKQLDEIGVDVTQVFGRYITERNVFDQVL